MHGAPAEVAAQGADLWLDIAVVVFCITLSAFFAAAETALTAASRARMHAIEKGGDRRAGIVTRLLEDRERFIGAMLLGNNVANITASALITSVLLALVGERGVLYATVLMTVVILVFAEVLPKTVAINFPDRSSLFLARMVAAMVAVFGPVLSAVEILVRGILRLFGVDLDENRSILSGVEELKSAVDLLHQEGGVERSDRDMVGGLLDLHELEVQDVMVHRTKMQSINAALPPAEVLREVLASPHTRLPLWRGEPDEIVGVLHAKEVLRALSEHGGDGTRLDVAAIAFEPWFVPATTSLQDQLQEFLRRKQHFALVVDEYGEVEGLVTLEDILEEIVGDIRDEHDLAVQGLRVNADGSVTVDGSVPIRDLNRVLSWDLPDGEANTIAGLVIHEAQTIPDVGQVFTFHGFRFEVLRKVRNLLTLMRVMPEGQTGGPAAKLAPPARRAAPADRARAEVRVSDREFFVRVGNHLITGCWPRRAADALSPCSPGRGRPMDHDAEFRTWNVFRRRNDDGLCCAVSADSPVPPFLLSGEWDFGFAVADGDPPVTGFSPAAAEQGALFNGFYLFLAFAARRAPSNAERH